MDSFVTRTPRQKRPHSAIQKSIDDPLPPPRGKASAENHASSTASDCRDDASPLTDQVQPPPKKLHTDCKFVYATEFLWLNARHPDSAAKSL